MIIQIPSTSPLILYKSRSLYRISRTRYKHIVPLHEILDIEKVLLSGIFSWYSL